jgi:hypothetical protein
MVKNKKAGFCPRLKTAASPLRKHPKGAIFLTYAVMPNVIFIKSAKNMPSFSKS